MITTHEMDRTDHAWQGRVSDSMSVCSMTIIIPILNNSKYNIVSREKHGYEELEHVLQ